LSTYLIDPLCSIDGCFVPLSYLRSNLFAYRLSKKLKKYFMELWPSFFLLLVHPSDGVWHLLSGHPPVWAHTAP
jgi:hypothetical protein